MITYTKINNLGLLRLISRIFPLKHKLHFLIKKYLVNDSNLAINYYKNWYLCTNVTEMNRSTIEQVILGGIYSQPEVALIKQLRAQLPDNMGLIDVGGNIGTFFCQFEDKCDKIFVFEPIPRLNNVIRQSVEYNDKNKKIKLITKAAGDKPAIVKMLDNNNSSIVNSDDDEGLLEIEVTTLDIECADLIKVDFLKIDVEGYELSVLNGARKLIEKNRPYVLVEVHPGYLAGYGQHHEDVISFFESYNYTIKYYSFLEELRMPRWRRLFARWGGNKGVMFAGKNEFMEDINKEPYLGVYHIYCEPA